MKRDDFKEAMHLDMQIEGLQRRIDYFTLCRDGRVWDDNQPYPALYSAYCNEVIAAATAELGLLQAKFEEL